jgi:hypothetical protein
MTRKMQVRLVAALSLAEDEIHHPGAARHRNVAADPMLDVVRAEILKMEAA